MLPSVKFALVFVVTVVLLVGVFLENSNVR